MISKFCTLLGNIRWGKFPSVSQNFSPEKIEIYIYIFSAFHWENHSLGKIIYRGKLFMGEDFVGECYTPGKISRQNSVSLPSLITKVQKCLCNVFVDEVRSRNEG